MPLRNQNLETAELLCTVISNAPVVLFALDADGVFTLSEGRGLDALGLRPGEVVGKSVFDVYVEYPRVLECCRRALKGETLSCTMSVQGLTFETNFSPRLDWGGKVTGLLGVATDVTKAYRASAAKDEFLSVISHELRTPLSSATGWAWLMRAGELTSPESTKALDTICRNLEDIKRLIGELRDASEGATGRLRLTPKPMDLGAAIREAAKALAAAAEAKELTLSVQAPTLRALADKERIRQIAWILLSNAVKFSPKGGDVEIRLERRDEGVSLTVTDQGPGLPTSLRGQIFDLARFPADDMPSHGRGLGLGLSIARRLAELHGGGIEFADAPGGGTVFTVRLPLSTNRARPSQKRGSVPSIRRKKGTP